MGNKICKCLKGSAVVAQIARGLGLSVDQINEGNLDAFLGDKGRTVFGGETVVWNHKGRVRSATEAEPTVDVPHPHTP